MKKRRRNDDNFIEFNIEMILLNLFIMIDQQVKMSKGNNGQPNDGKVILAFVQYLKALNFTICSEEDLFEGKVLLEFLKSIQDLNGLITDDNFGSMPRNNGIMVFKKILNVIGNLRHNTASSDQHATSDINLFDICNQKSTKQLNKVLRAIFKLAVQAQNKGFFISAVMRLNSQSQQILAEFLKCDQVFNEIFSPEKQEKSNISKKDNSERRKIQDIELIDRIYDFEQENQKLTNEVYQLQLENSSLSQSLAKLQRNYGFLKQENQDFRALVIEYSETMESLKSKSQQEKQASKIQINMEQISKLTKQFNDKEQLLKIQIQGLKKKNDKKSKESNELIRLERDKNKELSQTIENLKDQIQQLVQRYNRIQKQQKQDNQIMQLLKEKNRQLQEKVATLKFQLNYKDSQIEELKEIILNASTFTAKEDQVQIRKPIVLGDLTQPSTVSPKSMLKLDMQQLKSLRLQVKQQARQINSLRKLKAQNKELQYEKKKLMKILKEYEVSRGEENQILSGCVYELRMKWKEKTD